MCSVYIPVIEMLQFSHLIVRNVNTISHTHTQDEGAASLTLAQTLLSAITVSILLLVHTTHHIPIGPTVLPRLHRSCQEEYNRTSRSLSNTHCFISYLSYRSSQWTWAYWIVVNISGMSSMSLRFVNIVI